MTVFELGRSPEAITLFERALAIRKTCLPPDHPDTLGTIEFLTNVRLEMTAGHQPIAPRQPKKTAVPAATRAPQNTLSQAERDKLEKELLREDEVEAKSKGKTKKKK